MSEETVNAIAANMAQRAADEIDARIITGFDPARPGADHTVRTAVQPAFRVVSDAQRAVERDWNRDPVRFARDLGVELNRKERQVLRDAMKGKTSGKIHRKVLEAVRQKIEAGLRRATAASVDAATELAP